MGLLDLLRNPATRPSVDQPPIGRSGRANYSGFIQSDEINPRLAGNLGLRKFDEMYWSDADIRRLVLMCWTPIQAGTWDIEPYGGDEATAKDIEAAEFMKWALWEAMSPSFPRHLETLGPVLLRAGFAPFERLLATATWRGRKVIVPRKLDLRLPRTIWRWHQDDFGELTAIDQFLPSARQVTIPASDLLYYRIQSEGDNWTGRSLLRAAYGNWYLKSRLEQIDAIGQERKAVGVPIIYPPGGASDEQKSAIEAIFASLHVNEEGYVIMPGPAARFLRDAAAQGWHVDIVTFDSSAGSGIQDSLRYHSEKISSSVVGDFMQLGHHQVGARATADVQEDPFLTVVRALGIGVIADTLNEQLVSPLAAMNFTDLGGFPKLTLSLHDEASLSELSTFVQQLVASGAMQADPELEDYLRERAALPPANQEIREQRQEAAQAAREQIGSAAANPVAQAGAEKGETPQPPNAAAERDAPSRPAPKKTLEQGDLAWYERLLSAGRIVPALDDARERFATAGKPAAYSLAQTIAQRVATNRPIPADLPTDDLEAALRAEMEHLHGIGYQTVLDELAEQHRRLGTTPTTQLAAADTAAAIGAGLRNARRRAKLAARNVRDEIRKAVERAGVTGAKGAAALQQAGEQAATRALSLEGKLNAAGGINGGRSDAARANSGDIAGGIYTCVLDERSCDQCQIADDGIVRSLDDPVLQAIDPPNPLCAGGDFCRCMIVWVLADDPAALDIGG